ncbi:MAG TPA: Asp-tRNA(Asn)/Glu-tRNA(Gln) amidotransferase GatCAB subunit C [Gammaproteobacteria bacterium]|nr:Asp-tRNA(Asn)/Glu-tRNA(Gln) amidotransferase GatCAB subunit C [Gammaproteobacteria bacterium]
MSLESSDVEKIAHLARIEIQPEQVEEYASNLSEILDLVEQMNEIDTNRIETMAHPQDTALRLRDDRVTEQDMRSRFLALSPASETGLFLVPKVIE